MNSEDIDAHRVVLDFNKYFLNLFEQNWTRENCRRFYQEAKSFNNRADKYKDEMTTTEYVLVKNLSEKCMEQFKDSLKQN
jgi:hypothetical protein